MTKNQIDYASLQETKRHNLVTEFQGQATVDENKRHNFAGETETRRHNLAGENIQIMNVDEVRRHNVAQESETARKNSLDAWATTLAHARGVEANEIARVNAEANKTKAETDRARQLTEGLTQGVQRDKMRAETSILNAQGEYAGQQAYANLLHTYMDTAATGKEAELSTLNAFANLMRGMGPTINGLTGLGGKSDGKKK